MPVIFTLFISYGSAFLLNSRSIYKGALRSKNIPVLNKEIPKQNRDVKAVQIMSANPCKLKFVCKVEQVWQFLKETSFNGFPVINSAGIPTGIIERDALITLLEKKAWYCQKNPEHNETEEDIDDSRSI